MSSRDDFPTLQELKQNVRENVRAEAEDIRTYRHPEALVYEIASGHVPRHYNALANVLVESPYLGHDPDEPFGVEDLSFDPSLIWQILQATVFGELLATAKQAWKEQEGTPC